MPENTDLVVMPVSSLPTIAEVRQRMAWMTEFRPVLLEFVQGHMDPARHMYSFENNRYTPMTKDGLKAMIEEGKKPALNQDGIHNLMSLYEVYPDEPSIHEERDADGFYHCRATVKLISFRSGAPMGAGTGSCSTRETKYAYRWVGDRELPRGADRSSLKQREFDGRSGPYTRYRVGNEDVADAEATVLKMAVKRAKSAAVQALPLVSEMFSGVGDPDEDQDDSDAERQEILAQLGQWLRSIKSASGRSRALLAVFGEPLRAAELPKLDVDQLAEALQIVGIASEGGIDWNGVAVVADLKGILQASAQKAKEELFGDMHGSPVTLQHEVEPGKGSTSPTPTIPAELPEKEDTPTNATGPLTEKGPAPTWRERLADYLIDPRLADKLPAALHSKVTLALNPETQMPDDQGEALAMAVADMLIGQMDDGQ